MLQAEAIFDTPEQPKPLLGNRRNIKQLAIELNPADPPCERSMYNLLDQFGRTFCQGS